MKYVRVKMPDGTQWDIPAIYVAHHRAAHYCVPSGIQYLAIYDSTLADSQLLLSWAENELTWEEIQHAATRVDIKPDPSSYHDAWPKALKGIIEI